jgi:hypothetical protein
MKHSNEYGMACIARQDAVHFIEPSQMQVIESSKFLMFGFRTDFPARESLRTGFKEWITSDLFKKSQASVVSVPKSTKPIIVDED